VSDQPLVTWYANNRRAVVTTENGEKWWIAPDGFGRYAAVPDEAGQAAGLRPKQGDTLAELMRRLLGDAAEQYLAEATQ